MEGGMTHFLGVAEWQGGNAKELKLGVGVAMSPSEPGEREAATSRVA
jgi:hypothetical protein